MTVPVWLVVLFSLGLVLAVVLGVALWSSRSQRSTRIPTSGVDALPELLAPFQGLTRSWLVPGNDLVLLENGDGFFPALLEAIEEAQSSIHLEVYAWWKGEICGQVGEALCRRAREGVEVRLLVDAVGSFLMESELKEDLAAAGVRLVEYHPFRFRTIGRINKRDHRKLAIVDGRLGFVFGHGIAEEWEGNGDREECWRDLAARVTGPVVSRLQSVFAQNWMEESAELLAGPLHFPESSPTGDITMQVLASSPRGGVSNASLLYRLMIAAARRELWIQNPYFAPSGATTESLVEAVGRGVRVRILVPGRVMDAKAVQKAGERQYDRLLEGGVELYQSRLTLNHQKTMVVDRTWSYLGSANFDERSFDINAEVGLGIADEDATARLLDRIEPDFGPDRARRLTLEEWRRRPRWRRGLERVAYLINEQL